MNVFKHFRSEIVAMIEAAMQAGELPVGLDLARVAVEPPRDPSHGDLATNAAMVLAKVAGKKPRDIAEPLLVRLKANPDVVDGAVAGPGFINLKIADGFWRERLRECLKEGIAYGDSQVGAGEKVNVEYVSANPTGPLTVAHSRGAVVGDGGVDEDGLGVRGREHGGFGGEEEINREVCAVDVVLAESRVGFGDAD